MLKECYFKYFNNVQDNKHQRQADQTCLKDNERWFKRCLSLEFKGQNIWGVEDLIL